MGPDLGPNCLQMTLAGKRFNKYRSFSDASRILMLQLFYIEFLTQIKADECWIELRYNFEHSLLR